MSNFFTGAIWQMSNFNFVKYSTWHLTYKFVRDPDTTAALEKNEALSWCSMVYIPNIPSLTTKWLFGAPPLPPPLPSPLPQPYPSHCWRSRS